MDYVHPLHRFGLSYTSFKYANAQVSNPKFPSNGEITVTVDITNTGSREEDEVLQLYVKHSKPKVAWPSQELRGFQRVSLPPGKANTVELPLARKSLAYFDEAKGEFVVPEEPVTLRIASSPADIRPKQKMAVARAK
jgi:beta-glucosidase